MKAQTVAVKHQLPCTTAKMRGTMMKAFQSHSPTAASLKSLGAMIERQQKSRQKSSSMKGTTRTAPKRRTASKAHLVLGVLKKRSGLKTSPLGLKKAKWASRTFCMPTHWKMPTTPTIRPSHQWFHGILG